ncbi:tripartite tricarboxylate transporter TctB family protein [Halarsenatibacter silvermanii]|uniref:Tripartite tricarboxylate transporter TctB family protein n=1 Tax=Halarsenatibacter silvermanii TaxID=321763 RepID=A0A1G9T2A1_9FIRM|nr:tripartite tricarboxylate transporter TctB family protein [Halarsenatibacter silvermanii]SDM41780.1 Tripartite tricarboxylate transporter TctB family protein [Halarsenatibacter silvermanii]
MKAIFEAIFLVFMIIANLFFLLQIEEFPQEGWDELGPAAYPRLILLVMLLILIYLFIRVVIKLLKIRGTGFNFSLNTGRNIIIKYKKVLISILLFLLYIFSINYAGFRLSTFSYLLVTQWILSPRKKKNLPPIIIASLLIGFGIPFFFETYLGVMFPQGILFQ